MSAHEVDVGQLSGAEAVIAEDRANARATYERMLVTTREAARSLSDLLTGGIPDLRSGPVGARMQREVRRRINAYRWASVALRGAAQLVCDIEELPDDGAAENIIWEIDL